VFVRSKSSCGVTLLQSAFAGNSVAHRLADCAAVFQQLARRVFPVLPTRSFRGGGKASICPDTMSERLKRNATFNSNGWLVSASPDGKVTL
jgi:hypothetical protein